MGVVAEDILVCAWRLLQFSMRTSSNFVQNHPFVSGALLSLYLLYAFSNLLVFFSPFLVCVALLLRMFFTSGGLTILEGKLDEKQRSNQMPSKISGSAGVAAVVNRDRSYCFHKQKSRRTTVRKIDWDTQSEKERKELTTRPTSPTDLVPKTALLGRQARALNMRERAFDRGESSNAKRFTVQPIHEFEDEHSILDTDRDILSSSSSSDESETFGGGRNKEAANQDGNKALQWTDDDQRNLLDLGLSEIERNKRLESLIARRRTRKLFKMQIEKGLIDLDTILPSQIAPLYIAKDKEIDALEPPGSAPSVMFPAKNPFDLPYDPLEEKPDLKTDSFQQEFTAVAQRDITYCRHESFCYGAAYPSEPKKKALDGLGFSRSRKQTSLGHHDRRIERLLSNKGEHDELVETIMAEIEATNMSHNASISENGDSKATTLATTSGEDKEESSRQTRRKSRTIGMKKTRSDQNVDVMSARSEAHIEPTDDSIDESTSSEEDEHLTAKRSGFPQHAKWGRVPPKPLNCKLPSPSVERGRVEDCLFYAERGPCHTPTYSIASDLQVEVSDIGSPPQTVDGGNSPTDRESLNLDGDFEREYMWAASSSHSSRTEESDTRFRDMRSFGEKDFANMAYFGNTRNTNDVAESSMNLQQPDELDETYSSSSTMKGMQAESRTHLMSSEDIRQVVEEVGKPSTSGLSNALAPVNQVEKPSEKLVAQPKESSSNPLDETTKVNLATSNTIKDLKDEKKNKDTDGEAKSGLSKPSEGTVGKSINNEGDSVNPAIQPIKDNKNPNNTAGDQQKVTENEGSKDMLETIDVIKNSKANQDSKAEQHTLQNEVSENRQTSKDPIASTFPKNLATQEEQHKPPDKSTGEANTTLKKPTEGVSLKGTDAAGLKTPAEEVASVSQKAVEVNAELKETDESKNVKQKEKEPASELKKPADGTADVLQKAADSLGELEKSQKTTEEIGSISQTTSEAPAEVNKPAERNESDSKEAKKAPAELKKEVEKVESVSQKATMASQELKKPAEAENVSAKSAAAPAEIKKSNEQVGNVLGKSIEASAELKKSGEETESVSQQAVVARPELKKSSEKSDTETKETEVLQELKKSAKDSGSVTQKETAANADVRNQITEAQPVVKNQAEDTGSFTQKAAKTAVELTSPAKDTGSVSENATQVTAEMKKPSDEIGIVLQKAPDTTGVKKPAEENGSISQKEVETPVELKKTVEEITNVSQKASEVAAELKSPAEKSEDVSGKTKEVVAMLKNPAEETGNVSQKATDIAEEMKQTTDEIGTLAQKASEAVTELKKSSKEIGNVSHNTAEAPVELKTPAEEIKTRRTNYEDTGNVSQHSERNLKILPESP